MENGIIHTDKIYFRPITIDDIDNGWLEWINDSNLSKFLSNQNEYTRKDLFEYVENSDSSRMFAVCLLSNDQYIGNARLSSIDWENKRAAYGRLIGVTNLHGKGIGTEVLALLAYYAFNILKLNRIQTGVLSNNIASLKSNDKVGAVREGISRQFTYLDGKYEDVIRFGILKDEFICSEWQKIILKK